jgi:Na+/H+-dicarboxylate symporter
MRIVSGIMHLAPLGIMALLVKLIAVQDAQILQVLSQFVAMIFGTLLLHGVVILPLILYLFTGKTPL